MPIPKYVRQIHGKIVFPDTVLEIDSGRTESGVARDGYRFSGHKVFWTLTGLEIPFILTIPQPNHNNAGVGFPASDFVTAEDANGNLYEAEINLRSGVNVIPPNGFTYNNAGYITDNRGGFSFVLGGRSAHKIMFKEVSYAYELEDCPVTIDGVQTLQYVSWHRDYAKDDDKLVIQAWNQFHVVGSEVAQVTQLNGGGSFNIGKFYRSVSDVYQDGYTFSMGAMTYQMPSVTESNLTYAFLSYGTHAGTVSKIGFDAVTALIPKHEVPIRKFIPYPDRYTFGGPEIIDGGDVTAVGSIGGDSFRPVTGNHYFLDYQYAAAVRHGSGSSAVTNVYLTDLHKAGWNLHVGVHSLDCYGRRPISTWSNGIVFARWHGERLDIAGGPNEVDLNDTITLQFYPYEPNPPSQQQAEDSFYFYENYADYDNPAQQRNTVRSGTITAHGMIDGNVTFGGMLPNQHTSMSTPLSGGYKIDWAQDGDEVSRVSSSQNYMNWNDNGTPATLRCSDIILGGGWFSGFHAENDYAGETADRNTATRIAVYEKVTSIPDWDSAELPYGQRENYLDVPIKMVL